MVNMMLQEDIDSQCKAEGLKDQLDLIWSSSTNFGVTSRQTNWRAVRMRPIYTETFEPAFLVAYIIRNPIMSISSPVIPLGIHFKFV